MAELYNFYRPDKQTTRPHPASKPPRELSSRVGAQVLAKEIEAWWHRIGYPQVRAWVDSAVFCSDKGNIFTVRTNLIRGMPPRKAPTEEAQ